jgi:hypothetical protein
MATKQRGQSLRIGDTAQLKMFVFNGSLPTNVQSVEKVEIYRLYATEVTDTNPFGKLLVETIPQPSIVNNAEGEYYIDVLLESPKYTIDRYSDEWYLVFDTTLPAAISEQIFEIQPNAWFTDSRPIIHDFGFEFTPNKVVSGSKRYLEIEVTPNVPRNSEKLNYYKNLVSAGELYISIEAACVPCLPEEEDLRLVVDRELVTERDYCHGHYFLDTTELDCGIYYVWFELNLGPNVFISDKQPLQIFN